MKILKNKLISRKLIYALTLIIAIAGIMFITTKTCTKAKISKELPDFSKSVRVSKIEFDETKTIQTELKTTSRNGEESRDNTNDQKDKEVINVVTETEKNDTTKTVSIKDVKISKDMDLTVRTGLSREEFIKLMAGVKQDTSGFFEENAGKIYDLCEQYQINEIFFCGLISAESGWNIASNHRATHNYISLMSKGKLIYYSSVDEGLEVAAQKLHNNYLTTNGKFYHGKTLAGVKVCFCPASSTWVELVYGRMQQILK